jgi:hypothetical protein
MWVTFSRSSAILYLKSISLQLRRCYFDKGFRCVWYREGELKDLSFYSTYNVSYQIHKIQVSPDPQLDGIRHGEITWKSNFIFRYVNVPRVKSTDPPTYKFTNYTRILGVTLNQRKICHAASTAHCFLHLFFYSLCSSEARQIRQYWKGNVLSWRHVDALLFSPKSVPTQVFPQIGSQIQ